MTRNHNPMLDSLPTTYEAPEMLELGEAALLTLGAYGCRDDGCDCTKSGTDDQFDF